MFIDFLLNITDWVEAAWSITDLPPAAPGILLLLLLVDLGLLGSSFLQFSTKAKSMIGPGSDKFILWERRFFTQMEIIRSVAYFIHFRKANMKWHQICLNFWKRSRFSFLISKADREAISWHQNMEIKSELDLVLQKEIWWDGSQTYLGFRVALAVARSRNISFYEDCLFTAECNCKLTAGVVASPKTTQTELARRWWTFFWICMLFSIENAKFWPLLPFFCWRI